MSRDASIFHHGVMSWGLCQGDCCCATCGPVRLSPRCFAIGVGLLEIITSWSNRSTTPP